MQIGEMLREAREEKSLTLDDIQEMTKIQKRYLVAIEQNEFQALPGRFYARAFIKEYAEVIGLDAAVLLAEFDEEKIETNEEETAQYSRIDRGRAPEEAKGSSFLSVIPTIIVVILIIGIIVVAWMFLQKSSNDSDNDVVQNDNEVIRDANEGKQATNNNENNETENNNENAENEQNNENEKDEEEEETGSFEVDEVGEEVSPLSTLTYTHNGDKLEVELKVEEEVYFEVRSESDEVYYADTYTPDDDLEPIDVSDEEKVYFNIGNASGLTVLINGVEMEYPVDKNEKQHQKIWVNFVKN